MLDRHTRDEERAEGLTKKVAQQLTQDDRELLARPDIKSSFIEGICESFHQGSNGPAYDGRLYGQPWGFELEDIAFDSVHLWHGERDQFVPVSIARSMAKAIPNCQARFYPNDTHRSIGYNHLEEFMASLLS